MPSIGEELMFLCLIQLIGGLTPKNGARETNLQTKISSSRLNSSNHVVLLTFSDYYDSVVDFSGGTISWRETVPTEV